MAKRVTPDQFQAAIMGILQDYEDDVARYTQEAVKQVVKKGAQQVKAASGIFGGSGRYSRGWTSQVEDGRLSSQGAVYNRDVPGLPHLLEHGHAKRGGGRTSGREHIAPVEQEMIEAFEKALEAKL